MGKLLSVFRKNPLPLWRVMLRADTARGEIANHGLWGGIQNFIWWDGYSALLFYRLSSHFHQKNRYYWSMVFYRLNVLMNGCSIERQVEIDKGLMLPHPIGIVIGERAKIGRNAHIHQNVTMGRRRHDQMETKGQENEIVLGDNVVVYAGAVIVAGVRIGNNVEIGANSVVLSDVPDDCIAIGIPARIIKRPTGGACQK